jgi:hypothetical protein
VPPNEQAARRSPVSSFECVGGYAALSHMAVSNALLISGMFMPKLEFVELLAAPLADFCV